MISSFTYICFTLLLVCKAQTDEDKIQAHALFQIDASGKTLSLKYEGELDNIRGGEQRNANEIVMMEEDAQIAHENDEHVQQDLQTSLPPRMNLTLRFVEDQSMRNYMGPTRFESWYPKVLALAQSFFYHQSLETRITLTVADVVSAVQTVSATSANLAKVRDFPPNDDILTIWFAKDDISYETVSIGYVGSLCNARYSVGIVEVQNSDIRTAQVLVHTIGHALGMHHDFSSSGGHRYSRGHICTNIGGFMDYGPNPNKWSPCSVEDFQTFFNRRAGGLRCLQIATEATAPTTNPPKKAPKKAPSKLE